MSSLLVSVVATLLAAQGLPPPGPRLGTIVFPNSGAPAAQPPFIRGVLLLHSFEYRDAAEAFREAQRADPRFALAYWGEALSYSHPVWDEQDREAARAVLQRLGRTPEARRALAPTPREQGYLAAAEALYGDGPKPARDTAYSRAMQRLAAAFPRDQDAQVFYAVSLLGLSQGVRDVPTYLRAAAVAQRVFRENPNHPGAAHVLIHCYDDPAHARLGLAAARAYSQIAPDAPHAQHMTTHIFLALGMWDQVVSQNELAAGPDRAAWAPGHYTAWLGYGYLEQGRYEVALRHLELMRRNVALAPRGRAVLAQMRAEYVVNTQRWDCPCLRWSIDLSGVRARDEAVDLFVLGLSSLQRGERAGAEQAVAELVDLNGHRAPPAPGHQRDAVPDILQKELQALLRQANGGSAGADALRLAREAAALEDRMPVEYGPPPDVKPAHELLGEMLLAAGRAREAQREFARALEIAPERALSLLGLGRAATAAGDRATATRAFAELRTIWHGADAGLPGLAEAATTVPLPGPSVRSQ